MKAQSTIEFFILIGAVFFIFVSLIIGVQTSIGGEQKKQFERAVTEIGLNVQKEIELAHFASDGYSRNFEIPSLVGSREYEINIISKNVYVRTSDNSFAISFPVEEVTGDVVKGTNKIEKKNGEVILNG